MHTAAAGVGSGAEGVASSPLPAVLRWPPAHARTHAAPVRRRWPAHVCSVDTVRSWSVVQIVNRAASV